MLRRRAQLGRLGHRLQATRPAADGPAGPGLGQRRSKPSGDLGHRRRPPARPRSPRSAGCQGRPRADGWPVPQVDGAAPEVDGQLDGGRRAAPDPDRDTRAPRTRRAQPASGQPALVGRLERRSRRPRSRPRSAGRPVPSPAINRPGAICAERRRARPRARRRAPGRPGPPVVRSRSVRSTAATAPRTGKARQRRALGLAHAATGGRTRRPRRGRAPRPAGPPPGPAPSSRNVGSVTPTFTARPAGSSVRAAHEGPVTLAGQDAGAHGPGPLAQGGQPRSSPRAGPRRPSTSSSKAGPDRPRAPGRRPPPARRRARRPTGRERRPGWPARAPATSRAPPAPARAPGSPAAAAGGDVLAPDRLGVAAGQARPPRRAVRRGPPPGPAARARCPRRSAPSTPACPQGQAGPDGIDHHVADLAGEAERPPATWPLDHQAAADPGPQGHHHGVAGAGGGPVEPLGR